MPDFVVERYDLARIGDQNLSFCGQVQPLGRPLEKSDADEVLQLATAAWVRFRTVAAPLTVPTSTTVKKARRRYGSRSTLAAERSVITCCSGPIIIATARLPIA